MNSGAAKVRPSKTTPTAAPDWSRQLEDWRVLLAACGHKPTRKSIHLLRVATLRIQAQLHYWLSRHENDHPDTHPAHRWSKEAKRLRQALGAVRAYDVHLAKLSAVRGSLTADSGYQPRTSRATLRQLDDLEIRFKGDRKSVLRNLKQELAVRFDRLDRATTAMAGLPGSHPTLLHMLSSEHLSAMFADAASSFSPRDPESLHDFRKRLKGVRYLAETAPPHLEASQLAANVKAMQSAIGEWHDWEELSAYARRVLRRKEAAELFKELEALMDESLQKALTVCTSMTTQLLPGATPDQISQKKPALPQEAPTPRAQAVPA